MTTEAVEAAIVGGGPAGLSAALVLGRCRRRTVLYDGGDYRNAAARHVHGFLSRDGIAPDELRRLGRAELARYPDVEVRDLAIVDAVRDGDRFVLEAADGGRVRAPVVLLATGLVDELPAVAGLGALLGDRVHHCPYCDGWERRDQPLAAIARPDDRGARYALELARWSADLVLCTGGPARLGGAMAAALARRGIEVDERPLGRLEPDGDGVRLAFADGATRWRRAVFFHLGCRPRSELAARLGCELRAGGSVVVNRYEATRVPGVYVAGDATRDVLQAIVAAGEGAAAAVAMNAALLARET